MTSTPFTFKGQKKDFEILLELNTSKVLQIQAINPINKELYFFAIDRTYLREHSSFANIIYDPQQILDYFKANFDKVIFDGGVLSFPFSVNGKIEQITILLLKDTSLRNIYKDIAQTKVFIVDLDKKNGSQDVRIGQLFNTVAVLQTEIKNLKAKDQAISKDIVTLKSTDETIAKSVTLTDTKIASVERELKLLVQKDLLFGKKLSDLQVKDQKFDERIVQLDKKETEFYLKLSQSDANIYQGLRDVQSKYENLCLVIKNLKITDIKINQQIQSLTKQQEKDKSFLATINAKISNLQGKLNNHAEKFNTDIQSLKDKDTRIEFTFNDKLEKEKAFINQRFIQTNTVATVRNTSILQEITSIRQQITTIVEKSNLRDVKIEAQVLQFKEKEAKINQSLKQNDTDIRKVITELNEQFRIAFNELKRQGQQENEKLNQKIKSVENVVELRVSTLDKKNLLQDVEITKLTDSVSKITNYAGSLGQEFDVKLAKLREAITSQVNSRFQLKDRQASEQLNKLKALYANIYQDLDRLRCQTINLTNQLSRKDQRFDKQIQQLRKYQADLSNLVRCLASTDAKINLELQKIRDNERLDSIKIKESIDQINKNIVNLQSSDSTILVKISDLEKKDKQISTKFQLTLKDLQDRLITKKQANDKISIVSEESNQLKSRVIIFVDDLKKQNVDTRAFITNKLIQVGVSLATKASADEVNAKFNSIISRANSQEVKLNQEISARTTSDLLLNSSIDSKYIQIKKQLANKANIINTVEKSAYEKTIQLLDEKNRNIVLQISTLRTQLKYDIEQARIQIQNNFNKFDYFTRQQLNLTFIENITNRVLLGNHPNNQNSQSIKQNNTGRILNVIKAQTPNGAYNFVNKYEIKQFTRARYVLKIKKAVNVKAFVSFSSDDCMKKDQQYSIRQSLASKELKVNLKGRNGANLILNSNDQILCEADLYTNLFNFTQFSPGDSKKTVTTVQLLDKLYKGKSLFLQIASQNELEFDIHI